MQVHVTLFGNLGYYLPEGGNRYSFSTTIAKKTTVQELMKALNFPEEMSIIPIVNGRRVDRVYVLKDGDEINFFRPTGGG